jgi:S-adenosylmethionine:tRNA ribosyltransferase-isomerase
MLVTTKHPTRTRWDYAQPDRPVRLDALAFDLPPELEASVPPEARGLRRDEVRLMVSYRSTDRVVHVHFRDIGSFLTPGDVVVINTSGTLNAALTPAIGWHTDRLHLSPVSGGSGSWN